MQAQHAGIALGDLIVDMINSWGHGIDKAFKWSNQNPTSRLLEIYSESNQVFVAASIAVVLIFGTA